MRPDRDAIDRGVQAARAILAVRFGGRRTTPNLNGVACPFCAAPRWEPCTGAGTGRTLSTMHPSRVEAAAVRDDTLDGGAAR